MQDGGLDRSRLSPEKFRAEMRQEVPRKKFHYMKGRIVGWTFALMAALIETMTLDSRVGTWLLGEYLSEATIYGIEYLATFYISAVWLWLIYFVLDTFAVLRSSDNKSTVNNLVSSSPQQHSMLNVSRVTDLSWIDDHTFGSNDRLIFENSPAHNSSRTSLDGSRLKQREAALDAADLRAALNAFSTSSSPHSRSYDSIHTREQLERLLKKDGDSVLNASKSSLHNSAYHNILEIGSTSPAKGYQLSKELPFSDDKNQSSYLRMLANGRVGLSVSPSQMDRDAASEDLENLRVFLQQAKQTSKKAGGSPLLRRSDSTERRRRSHSSPDRQLVPKSFAQLPEIDSHKRELDEETYLRGDGKLRCWLASTVIVPLYKQIQRVNIALEKEHATPPLRIGLSTVDQLKAALTARPHLLSTALPYVIPYLGAHSNQAYIVSRIATLAGDAYMRSFSWNSGGPEGMEEKHSTARGVRRPWGEHLPTDSSLVFSLFCSFLDSKLTANPLVAGGTIDQPFTQIYTLKAPSKPNAVQSAPKSFYIHMITQMPPSFELVTNDESGIAARHAVDKGANNLFRVILQLIHHVEEENHGYLDRLSVGSNGLNLTSVFY